MNELSEITSNRDLEIAFESLQCTRKIRSATLVRCGLLVLVVTTWLYCSPATSTSCGPGCIRPESSSVESFSESIRSEVAGRIRKVLVSEGQSVVCGQPLIEFDLQLVEIELRRAEQLVALLETQRRKLARSQELLDQNHQAQMLHLDARILAAERHFATQRQTQNSQIEIATISLHAASESLERAEPLLTVKAISDEQYLLRRTNRAIALQELEMAKLPIDSSEVTVLEQLKKEVNSEHALRVDELSQKLVAIDKELNDQRASVLALKFQIDQQLIVRAPHDAVIHSVKTRIGDVITSHEVLLTLGPTDVEFEMQINGRDIAAVHVGQNAKIKLDTANRFEPWLNGTVTYVASDAAPQSDVDAASTAKYSVRIGHFDCVTGTPLLGLTGHARIVTGSDSMLTQIITGLTARFEALRSQKMPRPDELSVATQ